MSSPTVIGRYEIIDQLGQGAMGSVFKARDPMVGRIVAIKTIHSAALAGAQSEEYRARFYREARASGALSHPGIVPIFDVGDFEGSPYLVMEFVEGRTLADAMKKGERFTLDSVCEIGQQIASALGYAHRQGVIHRDIKPANILMTSRKVFGVERPRITDFGIAKLAASEITTTGQLLGTPAFMPPEQFTGAPIDGRADLFSLGVILYSLATGEQPFPGESMTSVSYKVVYTDPVPPAKLNPAIPSPLERVILKCLAKNPADRFQTGDEVAQDLESIRSNTGATALRAQAPVAAVTAGIDADMTLARTTGGLPYQPSQLAAPAGTKQPPPPVPAKKKGSKLVPLSVTALILLGAVGAGGWLFIRQRSKPAPPSQPAPAIVASHPVAPSPQPAPAPATTPAFDADQATAPGATPLAATPDSAAAPVTDQAKPPATAKALAAKTHSSKQSAAKSNAAKPSPAILVAAPPTPVAVAPPPAPVISAPQPPPLPAAPGFDPRSLDPKTNAKLKIELSHLPDHVTYTVLMNGKVYLRGTTGDGANLDNLFVPPGVQEFRVSMKANGQEKNSNTVSDEFKATKRKTLKIELRGKQNMPAGAPTTLSSDTQIFLSIKSAFGLPL